MTSAATRYILKLCCPDRIGIVAAVAGFLAGQDCNILESSHFDDELTGRFFMRTVFAAGDGTPAKDNLAAAFGATGKRFDMDWELHDAAQLPKVLIMVSTLEHCLNDLLYRYRTGAISMEVTAVVSNHPDLEPLAKFHGIPYHCLPVTEDSREQQERVLMRTIEETGTELVVLARYMQVLSDELCASLRGRIINIHHSFLPSFKGARPYHRAHARGVKVIGATAHYVTEDLDAGPIIEQDTARVTHAHTPDQLIAVGRDLENLVLARAVKYHCEHRILLNGDKTVVFQ